MPFDQLSSIKTVSQLTQEIKQLLEGNCRFVTVSGEISNLKVPFSGHHYFTLKDSTAQLRAVLFKGQQRYLSESLRDGQQVICRGRISVYEPRGEYQLIVDTVEQYGVGVLQMKFAALKKKLADEGLFDPERKKPLPAFPKNIVVISSAAGAAIRDFLKICSRRETNAHIMIFPVPVQGDQAPSAISKALTTVNDRIPCDLIVLCRGGGSIEDLWAFNEETVARAIARSHIPVVTGIGHETDTTIADLCADMRCPTPTGAAEMIIPDTARLRQQVQTAASRLQRTILQHLFANTTILSQQWRHLLRFRGRVENLSFRLDPVIERFYRNARHYFQSHQEHLDRVVVRLEHQAPLIQIDYKNQTVQHLQKELTRQIHEILRRNEERLARTAALLQGVSPLSTLSRGYAIVQAQDQSGEQFTVSDSKQVEEGDSLRVLLHKGQLYCEVTEKK
ncbi:exodeoxyribonuclease VII large subunit [Desulfopila aestuarii]|uniref:Exodeoxyribonuclease 7 large subunit n=1 Tax=Desulfopila aestuarii DSM 18488 TaxID=1121416 RepID=A0A1M7YBW1_9BACT|nr:exodeoxyribonuclease VII large subunit [Desulfopila aestuarii]SHO50115.1 Exodeoxyribonuclease VII large subunit [Desulfopila aestuarii DSM 18488]